MVLLGHFSPPNGCLVLQTSISTKNTSRMGGMHVRRAVVSLLCAILLHRWQVLCNLSCNFWAENEEICSNYNNTCYYNTPLRFRMLAHDIIAHFFQALHLLHIWLASWDKEWHLPIYHYQNKRSLCELLCMNNRKNCHRIAIRSSFIVLSITFPLRCFIGRDVVRGYCFDLQIHNFIAENLSVNCWSFKMITAFYS